MSDILRLVTRAADGTPTTIRDYENGSTYQKARGSFQISAPGAKQIASVDARRYGGARVVGESHDNGTMKWTTLVHGATPDAAISNVETMLGDLLSGSLGRYIEWRPEGASASVFYEVRGPASYQSRYEWAEFNGAQLWPVDVQVPVAPLARGAVTDTTAASVTLPAIVEVDDVPGAGALADVQMDFAYPSAYSGEIVTAMLAWWPRQRAPTSGRRAPLGIHEAATLGTGVAADDGLSTAISASGFTGGAGVTLVSSTVNGMRYALDTAACDPDPFCSTLDMEVWARVRTAAGTTTADARVYAQSNVSGTYSTLVSPVDIAAATVDCEPGSALFRFVRLGVLTLPAGEAGGAWSLVVCLQAAGANIALDYVVIVPARSRALTPTGVEESTLSPMVTGLSAESALVTSDLRVIEPSNSIPRGGLGGSPISLPAGDVDMLVWASNMVPNDPAPPSGRTDLIHALDAVTVTTTALHQVAAG